MNQIIIAKPWDEKSRAKVGEIVTFNNGYYLNKTGVNNNPSNSSDWVYFGEVEKFSSLASKNAENLSQLDIEAWTEKLAIENFDYNSEDESILIEKDIKNIENNVSLLSEEFLNPATTTLSLAFESMQILGVYDGGLKLNTSEYELVTPSRIELIAARKYTINPALCPNMVEIQYTHLKTDI